ncbi:Apical endosomal glycoprotein [Zootermopsis nevadensis]|uniref:Apical endosomal glycoprotein n=1 Tax=Zootermopsis nevadensis TaxID=136037 RepID=A0A067RQZ7_ZOONE|nr:Apical endosomal glycoprotein [Zootermopsis nevadensis]
MGGILVLLGALLWTRGASPAGAQLSRIAVQAPLVKYNFILERQEGIAPSSGTEATLTTLQIVDYEEEDDEREEPDDRRNDDRGGTTDGNPGEEDTAQLPHTEPATTTSTLSTTTPSTTTPSTTTPSTTTPSTTTPSTTTPSTTTPSTTTPSTTTPKPRSTTQIPKITTVIPRDSGSEEVGTPCTFGTYPNMNTCGWTNSEDAALVWQTGSGQTSNWLGGPTNDFSSDDSSGGYIFVETSEVTLPGERNLHPGAILQSVPLRGTGPEGSCVTFAYVMDGLSSAELRALLKSEASSGHTVVWQAEYHTQGVWVATQFLYTCEVPHKIMFEGIPVDVSDPSRLYRGFIAVDNIQQSPGSYCRGFCTFSAGFCDWGNGQGDDFDWALSRGSRNPMTGPASDSSLHKSGGGGYAFIDSSFPRRPGDIALLSSPVFSPTGLNAPRCMRFWFHMFGPVVGTLRVLLMAHNLNAPSLREAWSLSGSAGNAWFMAQLTISSVYDFQVVLEASVGNMGMSDIAVDDVTFAQGPCPVAPQVAAPTAGDCTFEVDECGWVNSQVVKGLDKIHWQRTPIRTQNTRFQRRPSGSIQTGGNQNEYYLNLGKKLLQPTGSAARLISLEFPGSEEPQCLCFWYFMHEPFIDLGGPSLGVLRILLLVGKGHTSVPIWQLTNNQGPTWNYGQVPIKENSSYKVVFEGMWGPNRANGAISIDDISFHEGHCNMRPHHATVRPEDCSFERGICGWRNATLSDSGEQLMSWQVAFDMHRPAELPDKTFGTSEGYIFFDIFTTNQQQREVRMLSPVMDGEGYDDLCFTFWYAAFGAGDTTRLHVFKADPGSSAGQMVTLLWKMTADGYDSSHPTWTPAQFTVDARSPFVIMLKGRASNGGFAVDDIKTFPGTCKTRPAQAEPVE